MEHTSATTMTDSILLDPIEILERDSDSIVAHELAHQWFGDLLTCRDWSNLWLNEGFASYFDPLFTEHDKGDDAFRLAMASDLASYLGSDRQYRRPIVEARYGDPWQMFDGVTYAKGACVLHALRGLVGDDAWWRGIKLYVATNKDKNVETADFRKAMETASGRDLAWFFDQWVYHGGHPELTARWRYEDDDKTLRLKVEQTQAVDETTLAVPPADDGRDRRRLGRPLRPDRHRRQDPGIRHPLADSAEDGPDRPERVAAQGLDVREADGRVDLSARARGRHPRPGRGGEGPRRQVQGGKAGHRGAGEGVALRERPPGPGRDRPERRGRRRALPARPCSTRSRTPTPRVRVAAIRGLSVLKYDPASEPTFRAIWANKAEPYGARRAAPGALARAKVKDADELIASALKDPSDHHHFATTALQAVLEEGGQKAREAAVLYSRPGQPSALRSAAVQALARQAKDDPQAEKLLIELVDDPIANVQRTAMFALANGGFASALPKLEQQLAKIQGPAKQMLQAQIDRLKATKKPAIAPPDPTLKETADLERQAADLELQAKELRNKAEALKLKAERAKLATPKPAS